MTRAFDADRSQTEIHKKTGIPYSEMVRTRYLTVPVGILLTIMHSYSLMTRHETRKRKAWGERDSEGLHFRDAG
jgi:hypothetical protein